MHFAFCMARTFEGQQPCRADNDVALLVVATCFDVTVVIAMLRMSPLHVVSAVMITPFVIQWHASRAVMAALSARELSTTPLFVRIQPKPQKRRRPCGICAASSSSGAESFQRTLKGEAHSSEQVIKKSRFIGIAEHCESWGDAQAFVERLRTEEHPKARHVCFGFVSGSNPVQERCSDDGEPTGTAGLPILGAVKGEGLSDTVCAVVRYSGGVKLGAGGLIRAYGGTARLVLRAAPSRELIPKSTLRVSASAANLGRVYDVVQKFGATAGEESYGSNGEARMTIVCESSILEKIKGQLADVTRGGITFLRDHDEDSTT